MIDVTVSTQTKKGMYYAVLYYNDPIKGYKYKWKSTKIKVVDESKKRLHNQAEQEANNKAEEIVAGIYKLFAHLEKEDKFPPLEEYKWQNISGKLNDILKG